MKKYSFLLIIFSVTFLCYCDENLDLVELPSQEIIKFSILKTGEQGLLEANYDLNLESSEVFEITNKGFILYKCATKSCELLSACRIDTVMGQDSCRGILPKLNRFCAELEDQELGHYYCISVFVELLNLKNSQSRIIESEIEEQKFLGDFWEDYSPNRAESYPEFLSDGVSFTIDNFGYIGTGFKVNNSGQQFITSTFWRYDPIDKGFIALPNFPGLGEGRRRNAVAFTIGDKAYVGTGRDNSKQYSDFYEFSSSTNTWRQVADYPFPMRSGIAFSIDDKGYVGTGYTVSNKFEVHIDEELIEFMLAEFGAQNSKISGNIVIADHPLACNDQVILNNEELTGNVAMIDRGSCLFVEKVLNAQEAGAIGVIICNNENGLSNLSGSDNRIVIPTIMITKESCAAIKASDRLPSVNFNILKTFQSTFFRFDASQGELDSSGEALGEWTQLSSLPDDTYRGRDGTGFSLNGKGYLIGGVNRVRANLNDFWEYDPLINKWTKLSDFPGSSRQKAVSFKIDNTIYYGTGSSAGIDGDFASFNDMWSFDGNTWEQVSDISIFNLSNAVGFGVKGKGYVYGGREAAEFFKYIDNLRIYTPN